MKKFAVILFAALVLTFAASSAALATPGPIGPPIHVPTPVVYGPVAAGPDYDHCLMHPPCKAPSGDPTVPPGYFGPPTTSSAKGLVG